MFNSDLNPQSAAKTVFRRKLLAVYVGITVAVTAIVAHATINTAGIAAVAAKTLGMPANSLKKEQPVHVAFDTSMGAFTIELYPEKAPKTVENFLQYVQEKQYDGTVFHRVIDGFMVQGGGFDVRLVEKKHREPITHEGQTPAAMAGGLKNTIGTVAMARTNDPNSAAAQFFINVNNNDFLNPTAQNPGYTTFGKVIAGMDVILKIKAVPTTAGGLFSSDLPKKPILIHSAVLVKVAPVKIK